jgi:hypothetical protein
VSDVSRGPVSVREREPKRIPALRRIEVGRVRSAWRAVVG